MARTTCRRPLCFWPDAAHWYSKKARSPKDSSALHDTSPPYLNASFIIDEVQHAPITYP
jgi:hypothetical protein